MGTLSAGEEGRPLSMSKGSSRRGLFFFSVSRSLISPEPWPWPSARVRTPDKKSAISSCRSVMIEENFCYQHPRHLCVKNDTVEDEKHSRENCKLNIFSYKDQPECSGLPWSASVLLISSFLNWFCGGRSFRATINTEWYQHPYTQLEILLHCYVSCSEVVTDLRLSSDPPTTTMLLSALSFSLNSSMPSMLHCRAFWPTTNNTGVFMSSSGSSTSCQPVTH